MFSTVWQFFIFEKRILCTQQKNKPDKLSGRIQTDGFINKNRESKASSKKKSRPVLYFSFDYLLFESFVCLLAIVYKT